MQRAKVTAKTGGAEKENLVSPTRKAHFSQSKTSPVNQILFLQRTVGNRALEKLLKSGVIQTKLTINQPGDVYEQEADRLAEQVMRMPDPSTTRRKGVSEYSKVPGIQRMCTECEEDVNGQKNNSELGYLELGSSSQEELHRQPIEEEEEEETIQAKEVSGENPDVTPDVEAEINNIRGDGQPLPESVRAFFEPRFGADFSGVRVHTDDQADESARAVNALAYTVGRDVVFGAGKYAPNTISGRKLLAHELTHVVQQGKGNESLQRQERAPFELSQEEIQVEINRIDAEMDLEPTGSLRWLELLERKNVFLNELTERYLRPGLELSLALRVAYNEYNKGVVEDPTCTNRGREVDQYTGVSGPSPVIRGNRKISGTCGRAWCAYFVRWCLKQAGVSNGLTGAARSVRDWGTSRGWYYNITDVRPIPGDIFYKTPCEEDACRTSTHLCDINPCVSRGPGTGHVGFILSVSGSTITTIEGNIHINSANDGVVLNARNISELDGVLRIPS